MYAKQQEVCKRLHKPGVVCRRCCSTIHNPYYVHMKLFPMKQKKRRTNSGNRAGKALGIEHENKKRPMSQDGGRRRDELEQKATDWIESKIYKDITRKG